MCSDLGDCSDKTELCNDIDDAGCRRGALGYSYAKFHHSPHTNIEHACKSDRKIATPTW